MLAPVIHYLVEAFRSCSEMALPAGALLLAVLSLVAAALTAALLRTRIRR